MLAGPAEELPLGFGDCVGIFEACLVQSLLQALPVDGLVEAVEVVVPKILRNGEKGRKSRLAKAQNMIRLTTRKSAGRGAAGMFMMIACKPIFRMLLQ